MQLKRMETILLSLLALLAYTCVVEGRHRHQAEQAAATSDHSRTECANDEYTCKGDFSCIPEEWRCDADLDCPQGDDERHCTYECEADREFTCSNGNCIPIEWRCDGDPDCPGSEDESHCNQSNSVATKKKK